MKTLNRRRGACSLFLLLAAAAAPSCTADEPNTGEDPELTPCEAAGVDTATSPKHCGSCDNDCTTLPGVDGASVACKGGECVIGGCEAGTADCNGKASDGCETDTKVAEHCGACDVACKAPTPNCAQDPGTGAFGCVDDCPASAPTLCGTSCVDEATDPDHCGDCDKKCEAPAKGTPACEGSKCTFTCETGFHPCDTVCAADVLPNTCGQSCVPCPIPANGTATCDGTSCGVACNQGYASDGMACVDVDECALNTDNCSAYAVCTNTVGGFDCDCKPGFTGNGVACTDVNECTQNLDNCSPNANCTNTPGGFTCACKVGYSGDGVTCTDVDECALNTDNCSPNATCTNTQGGFNCLCNPGYSGSGVNCFDVNECALNLDNCAPEAICTNTPGSFTCACLLGFTGDGTTCADVDECAAVPPICAPTQVCTNTPGSYLCECPGGLQPCGTDCVDVNVDADNCGSCGFECADNQACAQGVCVGAGNLRFTLVWSRSGDMDLHIITPNAKHIYYSNKGPNASTDFGQLDVDDTMHRGPENIFWDFGYVPPAGTYDICVVPFNFTPDPTLADPVDFTVTIARPGFPDEYVYGTRTNEQGTSVCTIMSPYYVKSYSYP